VVFDASDVYFSIRKYTFDATFSIFRLEKLTSDPSESNFSEKKLFPEGRKCNGFREKLRILLLDKKIEEKTKGGTTSTAHIVTTFFTEMVAVRNSIVMKSGGDPDCSDRLLRRASAWSGHSGCSNGTIGMKKSGGTFGHLFHDRLTDCTELIQIFLRNAQYPMLHVVGIGNNATKYVIGTSGHGSE
jgi:hypothetical protein